MPPGGRRWTWRWGKGRCCWLGRKEGCRTSCNTGSIGSEESQGRKDSPGKGNIQVVSEKGGLVLALQVAQSQADEGEGPCGMGLLSLSPIRINAL